MLTRLHLFTLFNLFILQPTVSSSTKSLNIEGRAYKRVYILYVRR